MTKRLLTCIISVCLFSSLFVFPVFAIEGTIETGIIESPENREEVNVRNIIDLYFEQRDLILTGQTGDLSAVIPWHQQDESNHQSKLNGKGISRITYSLSIHEISFMEICVQANVTEFVTYFLNNNTYTVEIEHEMYLGNNGGQYIVVEDRYYDHISDFASCSYVPPSSASTQATGDGSSLCVINIAKREIGYTEIQNQYSEPNYGYTKYGDWYGPGCDYNAWCAYFVAWCAYTADIPTSIIPKEYNVSGYGNFYKGNSKFYYSASQGGNTSPKVGDVLFMDTNLDGTMNHVGFVSAVNGNTLTVIDGNYNNKVDTRNYSITSSVLYAYGRPSYTSNGHTISSTWVTNSSSHWKVCENCNTIQNKGAHEMFVDPLTGDSFCTICRYGQGAVINKNPNNPIPFE